MLFQTKPKATEAQILQALSEVHDPDLHRDIVSLGFIKDLRVKGDEVSFKVELTTPACPVKDQLKSECIRRVKALGFENVEVRMTANVRPAAGQGPQGTRLTLPGVRNMVAIASGKGGVGKSTVTINIAVALAGAGARVGLLDADIYGPSIPMMMGVTEKPTQSNEGKILPVEKDGIRMISMGFLVPENQAVVWRGPMVHGALTQFLTQVNWGELDYLLIDMPPGTGDAQLTMSQTAPLSGAIIVTTPQDISLLDARRGLVMFQSVHVPVLGIVENMSVYLCPKCGEASHIFSRGGGEKIASQMKIPLLGSIPIDPRVTEGGDTGKPIVVGHPESEVARSYQRIAGEVAARLSILQAKSAGTFKPLSLEWR